MFLQLDLLPDGVTDAMKEARARLSSMETPSQVYFELPEEETAEAHADLAAYFEIF